MDPCLQLAQRLADLYGITRALEAFTLVLVRPQAFADPPADPETGPDSI